MLYIKYYVLSGIHIGWCILHVKGHVVNIVSASMLDVSSESKGEGVAGVFHII